MIIIIASEVADLTKAIACEIINLENSKRYFRDGSIMNHGVNPPPAYPTYTSGNRVINVAPREIRIYNPADMLIDLTDVRREIHRGYDRLSAAGIEVPIAPMSYSFATRKRSLKTRPVSRIETKTIHALMVSDPMNPLLAVERGLASIMVVPNTSIIKQPHGAIITDFTPAMLNIYDNAIKCEKSIRILSRGPVNQMIFMLSDCWRPAFTNRVIITALQQRVFKIDESATDYLHPVEHWPVGRDEPEYRTDLCTRCKSRLYADNYAAYCMSTQTLHAFCPLCVHCTLVGADNQYTQWYVFTHPRTVGELVEECIKWFPEPLHEFLRAAAEHGYSHADKCVDRPGVEYYVYPDYINNVHEHIGKKIIYGKIKIVAVK